MNVATGHINVRPVHYTRLGSRPPDLAPTVAQAPPAQAVPATNQPAQPVGTSRPMKSLQEELQGAMKDVKGFVRNLGKKAAPRSPKPPPAPLPMPAGPVGPIVPGAHICLSALYCTPRTVYV